MRRAVLLLLALVLGLCASLPAAAQQDPAVLDRFNARIQSEGRARVTDQHLPPVHVRGRGGGGDQPHVGCDHADRAPGSYEFRLLFINTYTVAARSPVVTAGN